MKTIPAAACALFLLAPFARGDLIYLRNGRMVEGEVVEHTATRVALRLPGGKITFPTDQVARVEKRQTYRQEFGERLRGIDVTDPAQLDQLALWASRHGLGDEAKALQGMAQGLRLDARIDEVRESTRARDYVDVFHWARTEGCSDEVLGWLLARGAEANPEDPELIEAQRLRQSDLDERAQAVARREELRHRPHYRMPRDDDDPFGDPKLPPMRRSPERQDEVAALQAELERQRLKIEELEAREPRRVIRRRPRANLVCPPDVSVDPLPLPPIQQPLPPGALPPNPSGKLPPNPSGKLPAPGAQPPVPPPPLFPPPPPPPSGCAPR